MPGLLSPDSLFLFIPLAIGILKPFAGKGLVCYLNRAVLANHFNGGSLVFGDCLIY